MRSQLVFDAAVNVANRYQLVSLVARAARALHRPGTRIQDTMNNVLVWSSGTNFAADLRANHGPMAFGRQREEPKPNSRAETPPDLDRESDNQSVETSRAPLVALTNLFSSCEPSGGSYLTIAGLILPGRSTWRAQ